MLEFIATIIADILCALCGMYGLNILFPQYFHISIGYFAGLILIRQFIK